MLTFLKPTTERLLQPVAQALRGIDPNLISLLGLMFPVVFFVLVLQGWYWWALLAYIFLAADLLDGLVARATNRVTAFGGFLDSTIDRFADFTVLVAFSFAGIVSWNIMAPLVLLSFLISYIRSRTELAAKGNLVAAVGVVERTERLLAVFVALVLYAIWPRVQWHGLNLTEWALIVLLIFSAYTVGQRVHFAYRKL